MLSVSIVLERGTFSLDVDFRTESAVTGLFGPSGSGKSTLIAAIAGLERPARGTIRLDDETLFDEQRRIDVPAQRRRVGVVFQEHRLLPHLSVEGNLRYGWRLAPRAARRFDVGEIADLLELGPLLARRVRELSGGERQRVALGRALLGAPRLLLLDEPLASLDRRLKLQILPLLERVRDTAAIPMLYVSHDLSEILRLTDRLVVLEGGRCAGAGPFRELVHGAALEPALDASSVTNVLRGRVAAQRPGDGVTEVCLAAAAQRVLTAPSIAVPPGAEVVLSIRPSDVALAAATVPATSIRNQVPGTVTRRSDHDRYTLVEVDIGAPLLVQVSRRSAAAMALEAGRPVVCLIKSNAIGFLVAGAP